MPLDHAANPSADAERYLDAVARVCDQYGVSAESRYADLPDPANRVHYLTAGDGPPLLLLHGLGTNAATWIPTFDVLTDRFAVYAPDQPGRGLSTAVDYRDHEFREFGVEYVAAFLDALGIEETAVMGNSLGGFQSLALAIDSPERVRRLCPIGAPVGLSRELPHFFRLLAVPLLGRRLFDAAKPDSVAEARETYRRIDVVDDSTLPDAFFEPGLFAEDLPGQRESLWSLLETFGSVRGTTSEFDLRDELGSVDAPARFVWGAKDYFWEPAVGRRAVREMPNAELVVLDDHGHMPWLEPDDAAIAAASEFLRGE